MPERHKIRFIGFQHDAVFDECCDPFDPNTCIWTRTEPAVEWGSYDSIKYVTGNRKSWNPVRHVRARVYRTAYYGSSEIGTRVPKNGNSFECPINVLPEALVSAVPKLTSAQVEDLLQEAVNQWSEQVPAYADLGTFIGELRHGVKEFLPTLKDLKSKISSKYLKYKFGIEPFVRDMGKFFQVHQKFQKRMNHLINTQGETTRCRFRRLDCVPGPYMNQTYDMVQHIPICPGDPSGFPPDMPCTMDYVDPITVRFQIDFHKTDFHATGFVTNHLKGLDNTWDQIDAATACLGLNNPFKTLWNLSPWTFVVDWFVDSDRLLDELEGEPFGGKLIIEDGGGWSTKSTTHFTVEHINPGVIPSFKGQYIVRIYERNLGLGEATTDRLKRLLKGRQFNADVTSGDRPYIAAALLDQRMRQRSKGLETLKEVLHRSHRR